MNMTHETDPQSTTTEALIRCAKAAEALNTIASLALAARLYVKAWELEHGPTAETPAAAHTGLLEWAAAEQARRDPEPIEGDEP
jgi:hypothetical protein